MRRLLFSFFLSTGLCFAQVTPAGSSGPATPAKPSPPLGVTVTTSPQVPGAGAASTAKPADLPATAPVITLKGYCPSAPKGTDSKSEACKTIITKAQFEKLVDTVNPKMPSQARQNIAADYAKIMVLSNEARKRGLEDTPRFREFLAFMSKQVAAQELVRSLQDKAKPTSAEVQKYYQDKKSEYEEISLKRIFIPRNSPTAKPDDKRPTDDDLQAEGAKALERLKKGEDFDAVQKDVYTSKGYTTPPPPTTIPNWRIGVVPQNQKTLFKLNAGEYSDVMVEPAGAYVYRVEKKETVPLDTVKADIEQQLSRKKVQDEMDAITGSVQPEFNPVYFQAAGSPDRAIGPAGMKPPTATPRRVPVVPDKPAPTHPAPPTK